MEIRWLSAFVDLGPESFDRGAEFWRRVSDTRRSARRGSTDEFATLVPETGGAYLRVQRVDSLDGVGIHLDLHVESVPQAAAAAEGLGASPQTAFADVHDHIVLRSPGGYRFCFVEHDGERVVPEPVAAPYPHRVDQVCLDIAPDAYEEECAFWAQLTEWPLTQSALAEFRSLERPDRIPLRILLQRRDSAPDGARAHAHLDVACGDHMEEIADAHVALGATRLGRIKRWLPMRDPVGNLYCITPRTP